MELTIPNGVNFPDLVMTMISDHLEKRRQDLQIQNRSDVKPQLFLILRGLPGSGKSTFAANFKRLCDVNGWKCEVCSADHWFLHAGGFYQFRPSELSTAHRHCQGMCLLALREKRHVIIIDNTNLDLEHVEIYKDFAATVEGYEVQILDWICDKIEDAIKCLERSNASSSSYRYPIQDKFKSYWYCDGSIPMKIEGLEWTPRQQDALLRG